jgi:hypothetical protein
MDKKIRGRKYPTTLSLHKGDPLLIMRPLVEVLLFTASLIMII